MIKIKNKVSTKLVSISMMLLLVAIVNGGLVLTAVSRLHNDAKIINFSGVVRGMIQRTVKLETNGVPSDRLIAKINGLIKDFVGLHKELRLKGAEDDFILAFRLLELRWQELTDLINDYRHDPTEQTRKRLIRKSESLWEAANDIVFSAQAISESKLTYFWIILFLIIFDILTIGTIIWVVKNYVIDQLEHSAYYDPLTGAFNRCTYNFMLANEISAARRYHYPLSVLFLDLDFFKTVNDTFGHKTGDHVLVKVSQVISENLRSSDSIFRIGGEEFAVIAKKSGLETAEKLGEKIRKAVEEHEFPEAAKVTVSVGVTQLHLNETEDVLFKRADKALYRAKNLGRNRVEVEEFKDDLCPHVSHGIQETLPGIKLQEKHGLACHSYPKAFLFRKFWRRESDSLKKSS